MEAAVRLACGVYMMARCVCVCVCGPLAGMLLSVCIETGNLNPDI